MYNEWWINESDFHASVCMYLFRLHVYTCNNNNWKLLYAVIITVINKLIYNGNFAHASLVSIAGIVLSAIIISV